MVCKKEDVGVLVGGGKVKVGGGGNVKKEWVLVFVFLNSLDKVKED